MTWAKIGRRALIVWVATAFLAVPLLQLTLYCMGHIQHPEEPHDRLVENILNMVHWLIG